MRPTQPAPIPGPAPAAAYATKVLPVAPPAGEPVAPPVGEPAGDPVPQAGGEPVVPPGGDPVAQAAAGAAGEPTGAPETVRPTGPVDSLPPLPAAVPVPDGSQATTPGPRRGLRSGALLRLALAAVAVAALEVGLTLRFGTSPLWSGVPLWAGFASLAALVGFAGVAGQTPVHTRWPTARARALGAGGLAGLAVFWLLVVLPAADTDRGFVLTAALACLGAALWAPRRDTADPEH